MKIDLTEPRGKKVVYELEVPPEVAKLLVRRDQTVEFQGIRYGFSAPARSGPATAPSCRLRSSPRTCSSVPIRSPGSEAPDQHRQGVARPRAVDRAGP
jgi:hypothetical protein